MRKSRTGLVFIVGLAAWIIGILIYMGQGGGQQGASLTSGTAALMTGGGIIVAIGAVLILLSWLSALVRTVIIGRWGWFLVVLVLGLLIMPVTMVVYLVGAADHPREARRPMAPA